MGTSWGMADGESSRGGPIARSRPPGDRPARIAAPDPRVTSRAEGSREGDLGRERQGSGEAEPATENLPSPPGAPTFLVGFGGVRHDPAWAPSGRGRRRAHTRALVPYQIAEPLLLQCAPEPNRAPA